MILKKTLLTLAAVAILSGCQHTNTNPLAGESLRYRPDGTTVEFGREAEFYRCGEDGFPEVSLDYLRKLSIKLHGENITLDPEQTEIKPLVTTRSIDDIYSVFQEQKSLIQIIDEFRAPNPHVHIMTTEPESKKRSTGFRDFTTSIPVYRRSDDSKRDCQESIDGLDIFIMLETGDYKTAHQNLSQKEKSSLYAFVLQNAKLFFADEEMNLHMPIKYTILGPGYAEIANRISESVHDPSNFPITMNKCEAQCLYRLAEEYKNRTGKPLEFGTDFKGQTISLHIEQSEGSTTKFYLRHQQSIQNNTSVYWQEIRTPPKAL